jgi:hypothetical protein
MTVDEAGGQTVIYIYAPLLKWRVDIDTPSLPIAPYAIIYSSGMNLSD